MPVAEMVTAEMVESARMRVRVGKRVMRATEAAALVHVTGRMWRRYERGLSVMPPAYLELFLIKTGQTLAFALGVSKQ